MDEEELLDEAASATTPRLILEGLDQTTPEFVNFMQVSNDASTFRIAFCRYLPPFALRPDDMEAFRDTIEREGYRIEVVSQLIVAPAVLKSMVEALQQYLSYYEAQWGAIVPQEASSGDPEEQVNGN